MDNVLPRADDQLPNLSDGPALSMTELAAQKIKEAMQKEGLSEGGLRMSIVGGGCSGFSYSLNLDSSAREDDTVVELDGVQLFVDPISQQYVHGTMLDYQDGLSGAGFRFVNPNAVRTCGCGTSFAVDAVDAPGAVDADSADNG
jgi:iron-sulfur cluster assembly accessory protein